MNGQIPIALCDRHVHLRQATVERLFGCGHQLQVRSLMSQPGLFLAQETLNVVGPRGRLEGVRIIGPARLSDQVELSRQDERVLGVRPPQRLSGDVAGTPGLLLEGPAGSARLASGLIRPLRHLHMSPGDAAQFDTKHLDLVRLTVGDGCRNTLVPEVVVRVSPHFCLELHLEAEEAAILGIHSGQTAQLIAPQ